MINGRTRLHVVANGTMTGQRYIDEVLLPRVRLFRGAVGDKFVFMDDNETCHRTLAVQDCLDSEGIQRLVWQSRSPDLNPIENVWEALGSKLLVETIIRQTRTPSSVRSQRNGINCLNSCWIMLCKVVFLHSYIISSKLVCLRDVLSLLRNRQPRKDGGAEWHFVEWSSILVVYHTCSTADRSGYLAGQGNMSALCTARCFTTVVCEGKLLIVDVHEWQYYRLIYQTAVQIRSLYVWDNQGNTSAVILIFIPDHDSSVTMRRYFGSLPPPDQPRQSLAPR
ncbi:transposable element Tc3 transposase [Trichonephila clavipes]|nr:transposable element Tc3 transposase [Trichonephila clavipes]